MRLVHGALNHPKPPPAWLKRLGLGGFWFFFAKGLLWLLVPALLAIAGLD